MDFYDRKCPDCQSSMSPIQIVDDTVEGVGFGSFNLARRKGLEYVRAHSGCASRARRRARLATRCDREICSSLQSRILIEFSVRPAPVSRRPLVAK
jgi:hypothetical protein